MEGSFTTLLVGVIIPPRPIGLIYGSDKELPSERVGDSPKSFKAPLLYKVNNFCL